MKLVPSLIVCLLLFITLVLARMLHESQASVALLIAKVSALQAQLKQPEQLEQTEQTAQAALGRSRQDDSTSGSASSEAVKDALHAGDTNAAGLPSPTPNAELVQSDLGRAADWKAQFYLAEVTRLVALTPAQESALRTRYRAAFESSDAKPTRAFRELLAETLGQELTQKYEQAQASEEQRRDAEGMADEVFSLSRKLALNQDQEAQVTAAIQQTREDLRPLERQVQVAMREAMGNHSGAEVDQGRLRASYDQLKDLSREMKTATDSALAEKLKGVLTEAQYNALLAEQASAPDRF